MNIHRVTSVSFAYSNIVCAYSFNSKTSGIKVQNKALVIAEYVYDL